MMERNRREGSGERVRARTPVWLGLVAIAACQAAPDETPEGTSTYEATPGRETAPVEAAMPDTLYTAPLESGSTTAAGEVEGEVAVVAKDADEPLELVVSGRGLSPGEHGWHVHAGPCESSREVTIPLSETTRADGITGPVDVDGEGEFEEAVDVPQLTRDMVGTREHSLHIHRGPGVDHGPSVACATI